jgi:hypothetical protein
MSFCEFFSPKGITLYAKEPNYETKVIFSSSSSIMDTWLYPKNPLVDEYHSCPATSLIILSTNGVGNESLAVNLFNP